MDNDEKGKPRGIVEDIEHLVEDVNRAVRKAVSHGSDAAGSVGETLTETIKGVRSVRDSVVMIRVDKESLARVDELVDSGLASSRSAAAAFLIGEGIKSRQALFEKMAESIQQIRTAKDELRHLLKDEGQ